MTMYGYYEDGIFVKPPLYRLDDKSWAKEKHKEGKSVLIGEYSIASGKWRFVDYVPPKHTGGRLRTYSKDMVFQVLSTMFPVDDNYKRTFQDVSNITGIEKKKVLSIMKLINSTYSDYLEEWSKVSNIDIGNYSNMRGSVGKSKI